MKMIYLLLTAAMSITLLACNEDKGKDNAPVASVDDAASLPKAWFTFAPQKVKCENLSNFMEAYQKAKAYELTLAIDFSCDVTPFAISRTFQLTATDGREVLFKLTVDSIAQFKDWETKPVAKAEKISGFSDLPPDLNATFANWVSTNALTPKEACEELDVGRSINAMDCLKNMN